MLPCKHLRAFGTSSPCPVVVHHRDGSKPCRCPCIVGTASPRNVAASAAAQGGAQRRRPAGKARRRKGFGAEQAEASSSEARKDLAPLDAQDDTPNLRTEYQFYSDAAFVPQRYIAPNMQVKAVPGQGRGLVCTDERDTGELLVLSPAMARLEGEFMAPPPEPEELHMSWLEGGGVTPAQRRVLDQLYDGSEGSMQREVSLPTLDAKFWSSRGRHDPQAPQVSSGRLLSIINNGACADNLQDPAVMTLRHQKPASFIGLWPEYTLLNHSCAPNTSIMVVQDRMLIHAACVIGAGEQLTRNYIPFMSSAPAPQRQAAMKEAGYEWTCNCQRCQLEQQASPELQEALQAAYSWYSDEALPRFNAANESEDLAPLRELMEEAEALVAEVEEAVDAEPDLNDEQRTLLRAAAYDTYDMWLMCDEFVHQERTAAQLLLSCLELLQSMAPGSESHVAVALKYDKLMQSRQQMMEALLKEEQLPRSRANLRELQSLNSAVESSGEFRLTAWVARYGYISFPTIQALTDAFEVYTEACEQMSIMASQGQSESVSEMDINGVKVSIVDKMDLGSSHQGAGGRGDLQGEGFVGVSTQDGLRLTLMEDEGGLDGGEGGEEGDGWLGDDVIDVEAEEAGGEGAVGPQQGEGAVGAQQGKGAIVGAQQGAGSGVGEEEEEGAGSVAELLAVKGAGAVARGKAAPEVAPRQRQLRIKKKQR